ncbi:MAG: SDR family oxidoreductase [Rhizobium sp.]|nr:SDR family oxidoreductase [Rhizobium sp.]
MKDNIPKTALVTGSAKRLGRAIAMDLARHGFAVAVHANRSRDAAQAVVDEIRGFGGTAVALQADLRDRHATAALVPDAAAALGPIGLLVNNASVFLDDRAEAFNADVFDQHFDLHVRAPAILASALLQALPDGHNGLIVNIIDQRVLAPKPSFFSYGLSKSTLLAATRTMAQAFAPHVRVNGIGPGPTLKSVRQTDEDFQAQLDALPLGRGPELEEFGRTIRFLFDTPSITGQMIALDGGQHLAWRGMGATEITE